VMVWFCQLNLAGLLWASDLPGVHGVRHAGDHREGPPRRHGLHQARPHPLHRLRGCPRPHPRHHGEPFGLPDYYLDLLVAGLLQCVKTVCADEERFNLLVQLKNAADKSEDKKRKKRS
jgi:hypothetical protein